MYLDSHAIEIPMFNSKLSAIDWVRQFSGVRLWHATRLLNSDDVLLGGLKVPTKESLDCSLLSWIRNKSWYTEKVDSIIFENSLERGESLAVYGVLDKNDLSLNGIDHYLKYGSEHWQGVMGVLSRNGYGVGCDELLNYGKPYIIGVDIPWETLCSIEYEYVVDAIFENEIHNTGIAVFRDILPNEISSIELC